MSTRSRTISVAAIVLTVAFVGCRHGGPYGQPAYYGYGQPGMYGAPGTYVAPGTAVPGPALQVAPTGGAFIPNTPHATVIPSGGGDAPAFDPATDVQPKPDDNLVPEYRDPGSFDGDRGDSFDDMPNFEDDRGFDDPGAGPGDGFDPGGFDDDAFKDAPFEDASARPSYDDPGVELAPIETFDDARFERPLATPTRLEETSVRSPVRDRATLGTAESDFATTAVDPDTPARPAVDDEVRDLAGNAPNPYANHPRFEWIRGRADRDDVTGTWHVIYSVRPAADDVHGGSLELAGPEGVFAALKPNDVVLVEGRIDPTDVDARGKPRYRVDRISALVPSR